jgi:hypothetical protein
MAMTHLNIRNSSISSLTTRLGVAAVDMWWIVYTPLGGRYKLKPMSRSSKQPSLWGMTRILQLVSRVALLVSVMALELSPSDGESNCVAKKLLNPSCSNFYDDIRLRNCCTQPYLPGYQIIMD